jgi:hypothetical protein
MISLKLLCREGLPKSSNSGAVSVYIMEKNELKTQALFDSFLYVWLCCFSLESLLTTSNIASAAILKWLQIPLHPKPLGLCMLCHRLEQSLIQAQHLRLQCCPRLTNKPLLTTFCVPAQ